MITLNIIAIVISFGLGLIVGFTTGLIYGGIKRNNEIRAKKENY